MPPRRKLCRTTTPLRCDSGAPPPFSRYLENINDASNRAVALIRNLLAFSRKDAVQASKLECNAMVRNLIIFLERLIEADIELVMKLSDTPHGILADQGQIEQVLVNLATNARDAMPEGGRLSLEVTPVELQQDEIQGMEGALPGRYVRISISDTGACMDEATRHRIFEPFFTTKEVGKGTGLGLSISYNIVKRHGGFITVASESGKGTTFSVYLPRVEAAATQKRPAAAAGAAAGRGVECFTPAPFLGLPITKETVCRKSKCCSCAFTTAPAARWRRRSSTILPVTNTRPKAQG